MTLSAHFEELRQTLLRCFWAVVICAVPCGIFWRKLSEYIAIWPLHLSKPAPQLIFTGPTDAVFFIFEVALACGILIASPFLFQQIWHFVAPGLYKKEKRVLLPVMLASSLCFLSGVAFCYFFLPVFLKFLTGIAGGFIEPFFRINEYIGFLVKMCFVFGLGFELPVISFILSRMEVIDYRFLKRNLRHAIIIIFIVGAVFTPTIDAVSLMFFGLPLTILYGISIIISFFTGRKKKDEGKRKKKDNC